MFSWRKSTSINDYRKSEKNHYSIQHNKSCLQVKNKFCLISLTVISKITAEYNSRNSIRVTMYIQLLTMYILIQLQLIPDREICTSDDGCN